MSATRRKGSRGGRAASRAGGPPVSNALTWAESLASGEAAPGPSALEWAEGLAQKEAAPSPWGSAAAAPVEPAPVEESSGAHWGPVPAPAVADGAGDPEGDANPWGSVAAAEPAVSRGRSKNAGGKGGKSRSRSRGKGAKSGAKGAPKSDSAPTPAGGFPLNAGPVVEPDVPAQLPDEAPTSWAGDDLPPARLPDDVGPAPLPDDAPPARPGKSGSNTAASKRSGGKKSGSKKGGKGPAGRIPTPSTAQQRQIKRTLRRGLPKVLDRPTVLVLAGVVAAVLGLGTGWGMNLLQTGGSLPTADAASCAQTQMAWTQAANAQSGMVEDQPDTLRKGFVNARNAMEGVTPPEAIAAEWAVAFTYYSTVANNIEKVKSNDGPAVISAVGGAQQELDTDAMVTAFEAISAYVNSNCNQ